MCQIKASAGSGKTYALTLEYLRHLFGIALQTASGSLKKADCASDWAARHGDFGDIAALTFTNAAVAELRTRVLTVLKRLALGLESMDGIDKQDAARCLDSLLDNLGQMNVRTIDSLLFQIVRSAALGLGLSPDFQPAFSFKDVAKESLEKFLLDAESGSVENRRLLEEVIQCFLADSGNKEAKGMFYFRESLLERLNDYLPLVYKLQKKGNSSLPVAAALRAEYESVCELLRAQAKKLLALIEELNASGANVPALLDNAAKALVSLKEGKFSQLSPTYLIKEDVKEIFKKNKKGNDAVFSDLDREYAIIRKNWNLEQLYRQYLKNAPIVELANILAQSFWNNLGEQKMLPSDLMPVLAQDALDFEFGICDTLCRLGSRLTHFLIDEFQDTSQDQWLALKPFVAEALSRGGSLVWVGDIKQSIFMWRGASPSLFDGILKDSELTAVVKSPLQRALPYNRRSARAIVEHNNLMFGRLTDDDYVLSVLKAFLPQKFKWYDEAVKRVKAAFENSCQQLPDNAPKGGYVNVYSLEGAVREIFLEEFAEQLIADLDARVGKGINYRDVLVLVRKGEDASFLAAKLAAASKNVISENSLLLSGQPLVEQSLAFLRFLDNPDNDIAFMNILEGTIFSGHPVAEHLDFELLRDMAAERQTGALHEVFCDKWPEIWSGIFKPFYDLASLFTPYDAIKEWYRRMGAEERLGGEKIFLRSFLEELHLAELQGFRSIPAFLDYWEEKAGEFMAAMPEGIDAVRIMTIHKAKGLAAPIVYVPLAQSSLEVNGHKVNGYAIRSHEGKKFILTLKSELEEEYKEEFINRIVETLDLLYVAFTRPREELHIYIEKNDKKANLVEVLGNSAGIDWPCGSLSEVFETDCPPTREPREVKPVLTELKLDGKPAIPWISRLKIAPNMLFANTKARKRGTFVHFCLENIRLTGNPERDVEDAWNFAVAHAPFPVERAEVEDLLPALKWLLDFGQIRQWLRSGWTEQPLLDARGNVRRADFILRLPNCLLVIDYKTGLDGNYSMEELEKHKAQIRDYMESLELSLSGLPVYGLLIYLDRRVFVLVEKDVESGFLEDFPLDKDGGKICL